MAIKPTHCHLMIFHLNATKRIVNFCFRVPFGRDSTPPQHHGRQRLSRLSG